MTTITTNPLKNHAPPEPAALPRRSEFLCRWFSWWVRGYLQKHFHAVRLSRGSRPNVSPELPLIIVLNHPSWWDPLIGLVLAGLFPERTHYVPMDAKALARYSLFKRLGFYDVEPGSLRGAMAFHHTTTAILSQRNIAVWITAQGQFTDPRMRPPRLLSGIGHVVRCMNRGTVVTLAVEYPFWEERLPEALGRFGEPILIEHGESLRAAEWIKRIEENLAATQDALLVDALSRDAKVFETLLTGNVAIGGIYDRWRRLRAWLQGERFQPEHGPEERQS